MSEIQELKRKKRIRMETMEKLKFSKSLSKKDKSELKKMESSEKKEGDGDDEDGKEVDDPLKRTSVPFGGCINEIRLDYSYTSLGVNNK